MKQKIISAALCILFLTVYSHAQQAEITITFNEQFFDALLDSLYQNGAAPEFPLARSEESESGEFVSELASYNSGPGANEFACAETIKLLRENNGVRTSVRFRDGKIFAPMAFSGNYNPPLVGCIPFAGFAETNIDLEFDSAGQRLVARARVHNVSLNGTGGIGGSAVARLVQAAIDRKINPIEVLRMDKISFVVPVQNTAGLRMKAAGIRHEIVDNQLKVHILYEFVKA